MRNIPVFLSLICLFSIDNLSGQSQIFKELQQREKVGTIVQKKIVKNLLSEEGAEQAGLSKDGNAIYFNIDQPVIADVFPVRLTGILCHEPFERHVVVAPDVHRARDAGQSGLHRLPFVGRAVRGDVACQHNARRAVHSQSFL